MQGCGRCRAGCRHKVLPARAGGRWTGLRETPPTHPVRSSRRWSRGRSLASVRSALPQAPAYRGQGPQKLLKWCWITVDPPETASPQGSCCSRLRPLRRNSVRRCESIWSNFRERRGWRSRGMAPRCPRLPCSCPPPSSAARAPRAAAAKPSFQAPHPPLYLQVAPCTANSLAIMFLPNRMVWPVQGACPRRHGPVQRQPSATTCSPKGSTLPADQSHRHTQPLASRQLARTRHARLVCRGVPQCCSQLAAVAQGRGRHEPHALHPACGRAAQGERSCIKEFKVGYMEELNSSKLASGSTQSWPLWGACPACTAGGGSKAARRRAPAAG